MSSAIVVNQDGFPQPLPELCSRVNAAPSPLVACIMVGPAHQLSKLGPHISAPTGPFSTRRHHDGLSTVKWIGSPEILRPALSSPHATVPLGAGQGGTSEDRPLHFARTTVGRRLRPTLQTLRQAGESTSGGGCMGFSSIATMSVKKTGHHP